MVKDYTEKLYIPAIAQGKNFTKESYKVGKNVSSWKNYIHTLWNQVYIEPDSIRPTGEFQETTIKKGTKISAIIRLGGIKSDDVKVEIYFRKVDDKGKIIADYLSCPMEKAEDVGNGRVRFEGLMKPLNAGHYEYTIRVMPYNPNLAHKHEIGLIKWVE
jgi:starch phosphorylase